MNTRHNASNFEFQGGPIFLIVECGSANVDYGADGTIRLFLSEHGSEAVGAGVIVQAERSRLVHHCVSIREAKDRWGYELRKENANEEERERRLLLWSKLNLAPSLSRVVIERLRRVVLGRNLQ